MFFYNSKKYRVFTLLAGTPDSVCTTQPFCFRAEPRLEEFSVTYMRLSSSSVLEITW